MMNSVLFTHFLGSLYYLWAQISPGDPSCLHVFPIHAGKKTQGIRGMLSINSSPLGVEFRSIGAVVAASDISYEELRESVEDRSVVQDVTLQKPAHFKFLCWSGELARGIMVRVIQNFHF